MFKNDSIQDIDTDGAEFTNLCLSTDGKLKGIIMYFQQPNGTPFYDYMPMDLYDEEDIDEWTEEELKKYESETYGYMYIKIIYWKLEKISCVLVCRNREWFQTNIEEMENFWKLIEYERINGYEHRQPNRRNTMTNNNIIVNKTSEQQSNEKEIKQQNKNTIPSIGLNLQFKNNKEPPKCLLKIVKTS